MSGAPAIVLLHGWACPTSTWRPVAERLAAAGHRVEIPPLLGYADDGEPAAPRTPGESDWTLEAAAHDVARLLERLGAPAVVVGHSLGGSVAATLAAGRPDLVAAAALVGMVPVPPSESTAERLSALFLRRDGPPEPEAIASVLTAWYGGLPEDPALRAELEAPFHVRPAVLRGSLRAALAGVAPEVPDRIEVPVAVVLGVGDRTRPGGPVDALVAAHPRWRLTRIAGAGHMVHWEAPEACAGAILDLAGHGPDGPTGQ
jgi:aminoacrylate hydrolase